MGTDPDSSDEEDDLEAETQLLPTYLNPVAPHNPSKPLPKPSRLADVWDEGEELFDIGGYSDDEGERTPMTRGPAPIDHLPGPKIVVTESA